MNFSQIIDLFEKDETCCAAVAVAVGAFLLGVIVTALCSALVCKSRCKCGAKKRAKSRGASAADSVFENRHPVLADGSVEIYVGNLSYDLKDDQLLKEFEAFGKVTSARVITDRRSNRSKGYGFIIMPNRAEAEAAIAALNDKEILGRKLKCNEAKNQR